MKKLLRPEWGEYYSEVLFNDAAKIYYREIRDYKKALELNDISTAYLEAHGLGLLFNKFWKAETLLKMKDYEAAANTFKAYIYALSVETVDGQYSEFNELKAIYEMDKLEAQAQAHQLKSHIYRNWLISISLLLLLLATILFIITRSNQKLNAKNRSLVDKIRQQDIEEEKREALEEELQKCRSLIKTQGGSAPEEETEDDKLLARLKLLMKDHRVFTNPDINRKTLSDKLNTNEVYLREIIRKHYNSTFTEYITALRLNYARKLLADATNPTIEAVAIDAGFGSRFTFYRLFMKNYNISPKDYIKML
jgi:AraC-like DNA-binding protein